MRIVGLLLTILLLGCSTTVANQKSIPITVVGEGIDFETAKRDAFSKAIEQEIGVVLLSRRDVKNSKLIVDDITTHSSGYVDDFKIVKSQVINNKHLVTVDVWVSSSRIAERVIGKVSDTKPLEGERLYNQIQTYQRDRQSGDRLLREVLNDYPNKAFILTKGDTQIKLDKNRNTIIQVNYNIKYNYNYLKALNEVLAITQDGRMGGYKQDRIGVVSKSPNAWLLGSTDVYFFNDRVRANMIKQRFMGEITVMATIRDSKGSVVFNQCDLPITVGPHNIVDPHIINGVMDFYGTVSIRVLNNDLRLQKIREAREIELTYTGNRCYNFD